MPFGGPKLNALLSFCELGTQKSLAGSLRRLLFAVKICIDLFEFGPNLSEAQVLPSSAKNLH